jgi:hypothetical protein
MKLEWQPPGLSAEVCEHLCTDLEAAGVAVVRVEVPSLGVFWLVFFSPRLLQRRSTQ